MSEVSTEAKDFFSHFVATYTNEFDDYTNVPIEETELYADYRKFPLDLTHFNDLYDTLIYSRLIRKALELQEAPKFLIDFGAGSSVPTLLAIKQSKFADLKTIAVDIDPEALKVSKLNAEALGLTDSYIFQEGSMKSFLQNSTFVRGDTIVVSNPPYIPAPPNTTDYHLIPINGGIDGAEYLLDILNYEHPPGTTLALLWGSLSNPLRVIPLILEKYDILHMNAIKIHFGNYTKLPHINSHLYELREKGMVVFDNDEINGETQIVIGSILRPKLPVNNKGRVGHQVIKDQNKS